MTTLIYCLFFFLLNLIVYIALNSHRSRTKPIIAGAILLFTAFAMHQIGFSFQLPTERFVFLLFLSLGPVIVKLVWSLLQNKVDRLMAKNNATKTEKEAFIKWLNFIQYKCLVILVFLFQLLAIFDPGLLDNLKA